MIYSEASPDSSSGPIIAFALISSESSIIDWFSNIGADLGGVKLLSNNGSIHYSVSTLFDILWNNLWDSNNIRNKNHHKEYLNSKQKFYQLKLSHNDILIETKPTYNFNEWGFPKGRRESYEPDLVCAIREFEEETTLTEDNYIILEKCKSIRENLIGTNGIAYAHNYFLSILNNNMSVENESNREIGQTQVLNLSECLEKIRPYHKNKIRIVKNIYTIINNFLLEYSTFNEQYY